MKVQYLPLDVVAMEQARKFSASACEECVGMTELCPACQDLRDTRDAEVAHQIVDEGNLQYRKVWSQTTTDVTQHDWISSVVKVSERTRRYKVRASMTETSIREYLVVEDTDGDYRDEFLDPIAVLADRMYDLETSITVLPHERICESCHLTYNKASACPNCQ